MTQCRCNTSALDSHRTTHIVVVFQISVSAGGPSSARELSSGCAATAIAAKARSKLTVRGVPGAMLPPLDLPPLEGARLEVMLSERMCRPAAGWLLALALTASTAPPGTAPRSFRLAPDTAGARVLGGIAAAGIQYAGLQRFD